MKSLPPPPGIMGENLRKFEPEICLIITLTRKEIYSHQTYTHQLKKTYSVNQVLMKPGKLQPHE